MPKNGRRTLIVTLTILLALVALSASGLVLAQSGQNVGSQPLAGTTADVVNLLTNGDMDDGIFYPRPTNSYVAWPWFQWWGDYNAIPEYVDGGGIGRQQCYPVPADGRCHGSTIGAPNNSSQGYIRWGRPYIAGIYQPVTQGVVPCTLYTFEIYNRNDSHLYHAKVGIDVTGWIITRLGTSRPHNCPPDGQSVCPDPYIESFPSTVVWSAESSHPGYTWAPLRVTAEAAASTISVWTYAAPEPQIAHSTYWDYGSLVQTPFPGDRLPRPTTWTPSGFVQNVVAAPPDVNNNVVVTWQTAAPASTQLWYAIYPPTSPVTPTDSMTYTVFFPTISVYRSPETYTYMTPLNVTPKTQHQVVIPDVPADHTVVFVALSRRPIGSACTTETSGLLRLDPATSRMVTLESSQVPTLLPEPIVPSP